MKHIIFSTLLIILVIVYSCEPSDTRVTDDHYIVNLTDKEIVHVLYINDPLIKDDSLVYQIKGRCDTTLEWTLSAITGYAQVYREIRYKDFWVYNMTDTTSLHWKDHRRGYEYDSEAIPEIFNHTSASYYEKNWKEHELCWKGYYYLTINDTLLKLMKKDKSMLERFKEYYQK